MFMSKAGCLRYCFIHFPTESHRKFVSTSYIIKYFSSFCCVTFFFFAFRIQRFPLLLFRMLQKFCFYQFATKLLLTSYVTTYVRVPLTSVLQYILKCQSRKYLKTDKHFLVQPYQFCKCLAELQRKYTIIYDIIRQQTNKNNKANKSAKNRQISKTLWFITLHMNLIEVKAFKMIVFIKRNTRFLYNVKGLKRLCFSFVRNKLEYNCIIQATIYKCHIDCLKRAQ